MKSGTEQDEENETGAESKEQEDEAEVSWNHIVPFLPLGKPKTKVENTHSKRLLELRNVGSNC